LKNGVNVEPRPSGSGFYNFAPCETPLPDGRGSIFNKLPADVVRDSSRQSGEHQNGIHASLLIQQKPP
jgi:hypothetical protein